MTTKAEQRKERRAAYLATLEPWQRELRDRHVAFVRFWRREYADLVNAIIRNKRYIRTTGLNNTQDLKMAMSLLQKQRRQAHIMLRARTDEKIEWRMLQDLGDMGGNPAEEPAEDVIVI